jgi:aromatic-L-amino-acid decarboxylase
MAMRTPAVSYSMKAASGVRPKVQDNRPGKSAEAAILGANNHDLTPIGDTVTGASPPRCALDLVDQQFAGLATEVIQFLSNFLARLSDTPASYPNEKHSLLLDSSPRRNPPEDGLPLSDVLGIIAHAAEPRINTAGGGFMAYVPGGGLVTAAIADLIAGVMNPYTGVAAAAPALVALEVDMLHWLTKLVGLPPTAFGILTSGASLATLSAFLCARTAHLPEEFPLGTVYITDQTHHATAKALRLLGFPGDVLRLIPVDSELRMDLKLLKEAIITDRAAGRRPFCIVANAGSTNTGTIDPLPAIAEIARRENLWFHVDAAYGGFFQLTERGRNRMSGIEQADSVVLDPHKGLFLPYGTGCLLVRDREILRRAHTVDKPSFLQDLDEPQFPDFADLSPELTRPYRGLRLWLPFYLHGVAAFRHALDEKLDLAENAYHALQQTPGLQLIGSPDLSIVAVRCRAPSGAPRDNDDATLKMVEQLNATGRIFLSTTRIREQVFARIAILVFRTSAHEVAEAVTAMQNFANQLN